VKGGAPWKGGGPVFVSGGPPGGGGGGAHFFPIGKLCFFFYRSLVKVGGGLGGKKKKVERPGGIGFPRTFFFREPRRGGGGPRGGFSFVFPRFFGGNSLIGTPFGPFPALSGFDDLLSPRGPAPAV